MIIQKALPTERLLYLPYIVMVNFIFSCASFSIRTMA